MTSKDKKLSIQLLIAAVLALVFGTLFRETKSTFVSHYLLPLISYVGTGIFLASLKMVVLPLIVTSIVSALVHAPSNEKLKSRALIAITYYFSTMLIAVCIGLTLVSILQPGFQDTPMNITQSDITLPTTNTQSSFSNILNNFIPTNVFAALSEGKVLPLVIFSIILGLGLRSTESKTLGTFFQESCEVFTKITEVIILFSPIGVFCLLTEAVTSLGLEALGSSVGWYCLCVILGLSIHAGLVLPIIAKIFGGFSAFSYLGNVKTALSMAFSTSSSSATLPVSIQSSIEEGGVDEDSAHFVLPIGATINMDGTALYEGVAVVFLAQLAGIDLSLFQMAIIALTATLAAIGAAGIPSAGLVTMVLVVEAVNGTLPPESIIPLSGMSLILAVDRPLDMIRTTVNVWGDLLGAKLVSQKISKGA